MADSRRAVTKSAGQFATEQVSYCKKKNRENSAPAYQTRITADTKRGQKKKRHVDRTTQEEYTDVRNREQFVETSLTRFGPLDTAAVSRSPSHGPGYAEASLFSFIAPFSLTP